MKLRISRVGGTWQIVDGMTTHIFYDRKDAEAYLRGKGQ